MHICMYVCIRVCMYVYVCMCIYIYIYIHVYTYIYIYIYIHMYLSIYLSISLSLYMYMCVYIYIYIYIYRPRPPWSPYESPRIKKSEAMRGGHSVGRPSKSSRIDFRKMGAGEGCWGLTFELLLRFLLLCPSSSASNK